MNKLFTSWSRNNTTKPVLETKDTKHEEEEPDIITSSLPLPLELTSFILSFLQSTDLISALTVCKQWHSTIAMRRKRVEFKTQSALTKFPWHLFPNIHHISVTSSSLSLQSVPAALKLKQLTLVPNINHFEHLADTVSEVTIERAGVKEIEQYLSVFATSLEHCHIRYAHMDKGLKRGQQQQDVFGAGWDKLTRLRTLVIEQGTSIGDTRSLTVLSRLETLKICSFWKKVEGNIGIVSGLSSLQNVTRLDLSCNKLEVLPDTKGMNRLVELDVSDNEIRMLQEEKLATSLTRLDMRRNGMIWKSNVKTIEHLTSIRDLQILWTHDLVKFPSITFH